MDDVEIVSKPRRLSSVWLIPVAALLLGGWLIATSYLSLGPEVSIRLASAEGLVAGETRVKRLAVDLGTVAEVYLNEGFTDVTAILELDKGTEELLKEDTQFWVVRPRVGTSGVSGLSTLLSGAYVEISPGGGAAGKRDYVALEAPPTTPQSTPGLRVELTSERAASLSVGSPVLYNGYRVGRIEEVGLSAESGKAYYRLFVDAPTMTWSLQIRGFGMRAVLA